MRTKYQPTTVDATLLTATPDFAAEANDVTRLLARRALEDLPVYEMTVPDMPPDSELRVSLKCPFDEGSDPRVDPLRPIAVFVLLGPFEGA